MARRDRKADARLHLVAKDEREQQLGSAHPLQLSQRQQCGCYRCGRMDHRGQMGVAEVMDVGAGGIEEGRAERVDALAAPDHGRLLATRKFR
jgi:type II secretory ATPase GspE/PulE/Tfp pilus assembly ATPase PilB-like protein